MNKESFRSALGRFAAGVTVVTTRTEDGADHGMTATAFSSLSLSPPLVLVCVSRSAHAHGYIQAAGCFAVNLLAADQEALSDRFAHRIKTADGYASWPAQRSKFDDLSLRRSSTGCAILEGTLGSLDCTVHAAYDGGDHTIFIGEVAAIDLSDDAQGALLYYMGGYRHLDAQRL